MRRFFMTGLGESCRAVQTKATTPIRGLGQTVRDGFGFGVTAPWADSSLYRRASACCRSTVVPAAEHLMMR